MPIIKIPFGTDYESVSLKDSEVEGVYTGKELPALERPDIELKEKLRNHLPKDLREKKVVIVIDDITRPTPSYNLVKWITDVLNVWGVSDEKITVIVARGLHRQHNESDLKKLLGNDLVGRLNVIVSDPDNNNVDIGETRFGTRISISKYFLECDYRITTGYISPHQGAGYTGGRKSIVPGIASRSTVEAHHAKWVFHENSKMGILEDNYFHLDMEDAAKMAGVNLIVNVVLNKNKEIAFVTVGELKKAHKEGISILEKTKKVFLKKSPQVVVTCPGGSPLDIDLRTSQKALMAAEMVVQKGGCIVLVSECREGLGMTESFLNTFSETPDPQEVMKIMKNIILTEGYSQTRAQIYYFARAFSKANIILVSKGVNADTAEKCLFVHASNLEEAIARAWAIVGKRAPVVFFPDAPAIIPVLS